MLPVLKVAEVIRTLQKAGFRIIRSRGSHYRFEHLVTKRYTGEMRGTEHEITQWVPLSNVRNLMLLPNVQEAIREGLGMLK